MSFSQTWLDELIARNEISSVVSQYTALKPKGRRLWGLCPIHGEKTPSLSVTPDKQLFYCFGCHEGGSVIQFVMKVERLTFPEAVRFLAERVGMTVPEEQDDDSFQRERARKERLYEACKQAARFYMEQLLGENGEPGRSYLMRRKIGSASVKRYGIGFAPDGWENLKKHLTEKGFTEQELLDAGLLVRNPQSGRVYDAYRNRVIFPIVGVSGRVIGFGARVMNQDKPKYINTGDTPIYNKRKNLYGLNLQKNSRITNLIMVEGYTDVIGMYEAGVDNVVASLGTALTEEQAHLLKRYVPSVYIAYDGDAAGQNATLRGLDILQKEGLDVRVIVFPDQMDPDEFSRANGREGVEKLISEAISLNSFKLICLKRGYDMASEPDREKYAVEACKLISAMEPVYQQACIRQVSMDTGLPAETISRQVASKDGLRSASARSETYRRRPAAASSESAEKEPQDASRDKAETVILSCLIRSKEARAYAAEHKVADRFRNSVYAGCARNILEAGERIDNPASLLSGMDEQSASAMSLIMNNDTNYLDPVKMIGECLERIDLLDREAKLEELQNKLRDPSVLPSERREILLTIQKLNSVKHR